MSTNQEEWPKCIARSDENWRELLAAAGRTPDQAVLVLIIELCEVARIRETAVGRITDQEALLKITLRDDSISVRAAATHRLEILR